MHVVVLYNVPEQSSAADEQDVLVQRDAVMAALQQLGHNAVSLGCTLNLEITRNELTRLRPDVVFNLVESLAGTDRLMAMATLLLDGLNLRYTGASTNSVMAAVGKIDTKRRLLNAGLPTAPWLDAESPAAPGDAGCDATDPDCETTRWILKPVWEHASIGMHDDAVVDGCPAEVLRAKCQRRTQQTGRPYFAERYIDGREFNLSMLAGDVLPPAEIDFSTFPAGKPRIVGHQAKWEQDSFEYQQTPRRFEIAAADEQLLQQLRSLARRCWQVFELRGFARVDFRVDESGQPWILEVNVNPCLSPDAGFAAALDRAAIPFETAIQRIIDQALWPLLSSMI